VFTKNDYLIAFCSFGDTGNIYHAHVHTHPACNAGFLTMYQYVSFAVVQRSWVAISITDADGSKPTLPIYSSSAAIPYSISGGYRFYLCYGGFECSYLTKLFFQSAAAVYSIQAY